MAVVANASAKSAFVGRMTERLTKSLKDNKLKALMMDPRTTAQRKLEPTAESGEESHQIRLRIHIANPNPGSASSSA